MITSNLAVNGTYRGVYPLAKEQAGYNVNIVAGGGNVTVGSDNVLITANIWYNAGSGVAADGTGFDGATTTAVNFLKECYADNLLVALIPDLLITEDAINTLTTESGDQISEEDF